MLFYSIGLLWIPKIRNKMPQPISNLFHSTPSIAKNHDASPAEQGFSEEQLRSMAAPKHIHALHWNLSSPQEKRELLQQGSRVERDIGEPTLSHLSAANDFDALVPPLSTSSERLQLDASRPASSFAAASHTSEAGLEFIAEHEGMNLRLYNDPAGHATIGVGHLVHLGPINGSASEAPFANGISREQALELLQQDVGVAEAAVTRLVTVPLNQNQFDALVSFTFNVGAGNLENSSLLTKLNQGDYAAVPSELNRWNKASVNGQLQELPGLTRRRQAEGNLFATPPSDAPAVTPDTPSTAEVILKEGSRGEAVTLLQQKLQTAGFNPGPVDGVFGARTASAVQDFQQSRGLTADGIVGPQTWRALDVQQPSPAVENTARVTTGSEQSKADLWVNPQPILIS
jgi:GH24 family phage-related lysozyme (muramidase)